jgi:hypothetical protein
MNAPDPSTGRAPTPSDFQDYEARLRVVRIQNDRLTDEQVASAYFSPKLDFKLSGTNTHAGQ